MYFKYYHGLLFTIITETSVKSDMFVTMYNTVVFIHYILDYH